MVEFCSCGSLMVNGSCTNKNCSSNNALTKVSKASRSTKAVKSAVPKNTAAASRRTKASKCITYNLNDLKNRDEDIY